MTGSPPFGCRVTRFARTVSTTGRLGRPGRAGEGERHLPQDGALGQPLPEFVALRQAAVVGGPDQPVDPRPAPGTHHEFMNIAFPISDIDQPRVRQRGGQFGTALEPFQPAHALFGLDRPVTFVVSKGLPVARPQPGIQHPQRHPVRRHRQGGMHVQPVLPQIAQRPQTFNPWLGSEIQLGRVLNAQHHPMRPHPLDATVPVRRQHRLPIDVLVRQQPIRRLCLRPTPARHRNARPGLRTQPFCHPHQPPVQPGIAQVRSRQFRCRPVHCLRFHHRPHLSCLYTYPTRWGRQTALSRCV